MKKKSMIRKKKKGPTPLTCRDELFCRLIFWVLFFSSANGVFFHFFAQRLLETIFFFRSSSWQHSEA